MRYPYNVMRHADWDAAPRDPISIGASIATALGVTSPVGILLIQAATYVAISAVTSWAVKALSPKPDFSSADSGGIMVNAREAAAPHDFVYGQVRKGGVVTYYETTGDKNKFLHQIIALAGHEVEEIGEIYIDDEPVTIDSDGYVTGDRWKSKIRVFKHYGSQTSVNDTFANSTESLSSTLLDESELTGSEALDSNFVGQGIAYLYVRHEFDRDVFPNGVPLVTAVVKGKKVFDPRTSTTAYSNNAALCLRDYIVSEYGLDDDDVDEVAFAAAANICDESVNLANSGGVEQRYTMNGIVKASTNHGEVLNLMVTTCAGTLFWGMGKWKLVVGAYSAPVKTLTEGDLRGPISVQPRVNIRDNFNTVRGTFNDADEDWITVDYPQVTSSVFKAEDGGEELPLDLELPFTTSPATAQRLAKLTLNRAREQIRVDADFSLNAFDVQVGDIISFSFERYGWAQKEFEVVGWKMSTGEGGAPRVRLSLQEASEAAFDWNAEESDIIGNNSNLPGFADGLDIFGLTVSGGGRTQGDGTFINTAILSWTAVTNSFIESYEVQYKPVADSSYSSVFTTDNTLEVSPVIDGVEYIFRVRAITVLGNRGPFSTVTFTGGGDETAPGLPTNITAEGGFRYITVKWTNPPDADLNYVEVFENASNNSAGATEVGIASGSQFTRTDLGLNETRYYFLRSVDFSGNKSAFTSGVSATTTFLDDPDFENGIRTLFEEQGLYPIEDVDGLPASGVLNRKVFNRQDGQLYEWNGSQWVLVIADVANGSITETKISDNAISTPKLQAGAVTATEIQGGTISGDKISANTITGGLLSTSGVITNSAQINDGLITNAKIENLAVDTIKVANDSITRQEFVNFTLQTGATNYTFEHITNMTFPGSVILMSHHVMFGGGNSGAQADFRITIDNVILIGFTVSGSSLVLSPRALVAGIDIPSSGNVPLKFEIENITNITNPEVEATFTILKRFK